jgi:hypothetical protein
LINSFHLLLCTINLIYSNIKKSSNIIDYLCDNFQGDQLQVKTINEHYFKQQIKNLIQLDIIDEDLLFNKSDSLFISTSKQKFERIFSSLDKEYELFILKPINGNNITDIDERFFILESEHSTMINNESFQLNEKVLSVPTCVSSISELKSDGIDKLKSFLNSNELFSQCENENNYISFIDNCDRAIKSQLLLNLKNDQIFNEKQSSINSPVDIFMETIQKLFYKILEKMLTIEMKRFNGDHSKRNECIGNILKCDLFHKGIYACCFEILFPFTLISNEKKQTYRFSSLFNNNLQYPWSINTLKLEPYDHLKVIELFVRSTTLIPTFSPSVYQLDATATTLTDLSLDKKMIKHLNKCEEMIVESLGWTSESPLWNDLIKVEINKKKEDSKKEREDDEPLNLLTNKNIPFPIYEDVCSFYEYQQSRQVSASVYSLNPATPFKNQSAPSSPMKNPTITRVVSSSGPQLIASALSSSQQRHQRLLNVSTSLKLFLRKYYALANVRIRNLVEKLDLFKLGNKKPLKSIQNIKKINFIILTAFEANSPSLNRITTPIWNNNNNLQPTIDSNQTFLKKIWNIFEFSLLCNLINNDSNDNHDHLACNRHLDQLIICAIYVACRACIIDLKFYEIIKMYRIMMSDNEPVSKVLSSKSHIYR